DASDLEYPPSETLFCLDQELHTVNRRIAVERKGHVDVQYVAERRAGGGQAQTESHVTQQPLRRTAQGVAAPGGTHVVEHRRPDVEQLERIPAGEEALLGGEQPRASTGLVTQRVAAQPAVAAQQDLLVRVEVLSDFCR